MKKFYGFPLALLGIALFTAGSASASPIFVNNFSFENLPVGGLPLTNCGTGCSYNVGAIPGWTDTGQWGQIAPGPSGLFTSVPDGSTVAFGNTEGGTLTQVLVPTVEVGMIYTFMIDLGRRSDTPFTASAALLIGSTAYTATGIAPTAGNWSTYTATYVGTLADQGQSISIQLLSGGVQANFDNVRLDGELPTPEPGMFSMLGGGLAALLMFGRRARRS